MKSLQALGILVAVGSLAWVMLADGTEPVAKGPAHKTASHSAGASAVETAPRWQPRARVHDHELEVEADSEQRSEGPERKPVRAEDVQACETSENCGDARACVDGQCVHCVADAECEAGMVCALSRCMVPDDVDCATDEDCGSGGFCASDVRAEGPPRGRWLSYCTDEREHDDAIAMVVGDVGGEVDVNARERAEVLASAGFGLGES